MGESEPRRRGYVHGFTKEEQERLRRQARFLEQRVHDRLPFWKARNLLEVGCGVGAQTEILLRRFPELHVTGVDASAANLESAATSLRALVWAEGRYSLECQDASHLDFAAGTFDSAFLCELFEDPHRRPAAP